MKEHCTRNARNGQSSRSSVEAQRILDRDILPTLGAMRAEVINRGHVMEAIERVADRGALRAADCALTLTRSIFNWACATGRLDRNPTLGLKKRNASKPRVRVLTPDEIRIFWHAIEGMPLVSASIRDALRLQLLTALRINEVTEASRSEIDFEKKLWIVPAYRTKSEREHVLPLSDLALDLLRKIIARADHEAERRARRHGVAFQEPDLLFPSRARINPMVGHAKKLKWQRRVPGALDPHAPPRCLIRCREVLREKGIKQPFNTHDLRRTVATHLGEMSVADEIIERILNHAPRSIAGKHYVHARYLGSMRMALDHWGEKITELIKTANTAVG
ncbi:MAG TPA: site-specific integrase [Hyphomicrobium sp.]|nr:site-specific integrase [Hyphomicrobium sp.]